MREVLKASAVLAVTGVAISVAGLLSLDLLNGNEVITFICVSMGLLLQVVVLAYLTGAAVLSLIRRLISTRGRERNPGQAATRTGNLPSSQLPETTSGVS